MDAEPMARPPTAEPEEEGLETLVTDEQISLQVGERRFTTTRQTLVSESAFFASLLSGRWNNKLSDGSYFIDADASLFEHVLRYLRRSKFPIFYDEAKGHDYGLYLALLGEAQYFGIPRLQEWLEKREYVQVVQMTRTFQTFEDVSSHQLEGYCGKSHTDTTLELYPSWDIKQVYICPRGISVHRGAPQACGRQCRNSLGSDGANYEAETILRCLVVKNQVTIRQDLLNSHDEN